MSDEPDCRLTPEQAIAMLPDGAEDVHTFFNPSVGVLLGADWSRESIVTAINCAKVRKLAGDMASGMGHGLAIENGGAWLFVTTKPSPAGKGSEHG